VNGVTVHDSNKTKVFESKIPVKNTMPITLFIKITLAVRKPRTRNSRPLTKKAENLQEKNETKVNEGESEH
jgi:hypothetical protein